MKIQVVTWLWLQLCMLEKYEFKTVSDPHLFSAYRQYRRGLSPVAGNSGGCAAAGGYGLWLDDQCLSRSPITAAFLIEWKTNMCGLTIF
jgi:hypothetical protein